MSIFPITTQIRIIRHSNDVEMLNIRLELAKVIRAKCVPYSDPWIRAHEIHCAIYDRIAEIRRYYNFYDGY